MPASEHAIRATDGYRARMGALAARSSQVAAARWGMVDGQDLDATHARWATLTAPALIELQRAGARLSAGYLAGYVALELRQPPRATGASATTAIGVNRAGKPLPEALATSLYTVKKAIGDGKPVDVALAEGLHRATRNAREDVLHATRATLDAGITSDDRIIGWRRVTGGGCGACLAAATGAIQSDSEVLPVHDHCQCTKEPVVRGASDRILRPTGREMFDAMTVEQQDQLLGPDKAQIVRDGAVPFHALIAHSPMVAVPDEITEAPLKHLEPQAG